MADTLDERLTDIERRLTIVERYLETISGSSRQTTNRVEIHTLPGNIGAFVNRLHDERNPDDEDTAPAFPTRPKSSSG